MSFALKVKTNAGQTVLKNLTADSTVRDLKTQLSLAGNIPAERLHVLVGFPPKVFDLSFDSRTLKEAGIASGETLILQEKQPDTETTPSPPETVTRPHISDENLECPGILMKWTVPADNSCLFSSLYFVLNGRLDEGGNITQAMRQIVAEQIAGDKEMYSEAFLGKPNDEYCKWIQDDQSWGGAIELAILSNYHGIEIAVADIMNGIVNRFGEDQKYALRVLLLFDGIHYDPLYLEPIDGGRIHTIFPVENEQILKDAEQLAREAFSSRQFTDVNKFTLRCMTCDTMLKGQVEAQQHAASTGHSNFGEV